MKRRNLTLTIGQFYDGKENKPVKLTGWEDENNPGRFVFSLVGFLNTVEVKEKSEKASSKRGDEQ